MAEQQGKDGALEELRKRMYSNEGVTDRPLDRALKNRIPGPSEGWQKETQAPDTMKKHPHKISGAAVFFTTSILFSF